MSIASGSSYPPISGWLGISSGYTSISFTTQSLSVPLVDATRCTTGAPLTRTGSVSTGVTYDNTSGRSTTKRWSVTSQRRQESVSLKRAGRGRYDTGFAGSDTYSSYAADEP